MDAELRAGDADRARRDLPHPRPQPLADGAEQVGAGLEAVLVEVVARALPRAEQEVPLEVGVLADEGRELGVVHERACDRIRRPIGKRRAA